MRTVLGGALAAGLGLLLAVSLGACAQLQQAVASPEGQQALKVSCPLDQAMQPVAVQIVGGMGAAGGTAAAIDQVAVHPFVTNLCKGGPVQVDPATVGDTATAVTKLVLTPAATAK